MHSALLVLALFQAPVANRHAGMMNQWQREVALRQLEGSSDATWEEAERREAAYREQQFIQKFNQLIKKLTEFGSTYNESGVMDVKKVEAIKKAWRDLEKAEPWFKDSGK